MKNAPYIQEKDYRNLTDICDKLWRKNKKRPTTQENKKIEFKNHNNPHCSSQTESMDKCRNQTTFLVQQKENKSPENAIFEET